jgi:hypothetical protein
MRRVIPLLVILAAVAVAGAATLAMGGTERRPSDVPPLKTPRLRALWEKDPAAQAAHPAQEDENAPEDETPTLNVLTAGGLPEDPDRHEMEAAMDKVRKRVEACQSLEQLAGIIQVRLVIDRSGNVRSAHVLPPLDETQTGLCVAREVKHASFPRFRGTLTPTVELIYPFYFRPADN